MLASLVSVTVNGLLLALAAPTVRGVVRVCELPLVPVAKFHSTSLVVLEQPVWAAERPLLEYPAA
jgi:hypothetical protein